MGLSAAEAGSAAAIASAEAKISLFMDFLLVYA
jgi:hypothetical protein